MPSALYPCLQDDVKVAVFNLDTDSGRLAPIGQMPTEAVPSAFGADSAGRFLFAGGTASARFVPDRRTAGRSHHWRFVPPAGGRWPSWP
jgi:6-phosphogluconolactonase (cycloisomerase 2 family)